MTYHVRYAIPGDKLVLIFRCQADDYEHAEEQFRNAYPNYILVNVEEVKSAPRHKANN
jgi:hypothetical protein